MIKAGQAGSSSGETGVEVECDLTALVVVADVGEPAATWSRGNVLLCPHKEPAAALLQTPCVCELCVMQPLRLRHVRLL